MKNHYFDALRKSERAAEWLETAVDVTLLHRFDRVVNLKDSAGRVLSVHASDLPIGPSSLEIWPGLLDLPGWERGIEVIDGSLRVGRHLIKSNHTPLWEAIPPWRQLDYRHLSRFRHVLPIEMQAAARALLEGVRAEDAEAVSHGARWLAGRGQGLTPAGDDVLVGILHGFQIVGVRSSWSDFIARESMPRTTTLSRNLIEAAAAGEANALWHALVRGEAGALEAIEQVGHTSGRDALFGLTEALKILPNRA